jgi:hypothetical protein
MTYDPNLGRWLEQDPIAFEGGDMNLYRFVGNSPTDEVDPMGEERNEVMIDKTWTQKDILDDFDKWAKSRDWSSAGWPADKIAKYRADLVALFDAAKSAEVAKSQTGVCQCVKWVSAVIDNWKAKTNFVKTETESWEYPAGIPFTDHFLGHSALKVDLPNGRSFYLDNGWWGNSEHIFGSLDRSALAQPVGYFEKPWWPVKVIGKLW